MGQWHKKHLSDVKRWTKLCARLLCNVYHAPALVEKSLRYILKVKLRDWQEVPKRQFETGRFQTDTFELR